MSTNKVEDHEIYLKKLKNVKTAFEFLRYQPPAHYQTWGYGEPTESNVRELLSSNSEFGIYLNDQLVGIIGFRYKGQYFIPLYNGQFWINYLVDKNYVGRGIASVALKLLLELIRDNTTIRRVYAGINSDNPASLALIKKFGFVKRSQRGRTQVFEKFIDREDSQLSD